jgi:phospholipid/cholesterol/gamma-HCH transport system permease protein
MAGFVGTWVDTFRSNGEGMTLAAHMEASPIYSPLSSASEIASVASRTLREAATSLGWVREALVEASAMFRKSIVPLAIASAIYSISFATNLLGKVVYALGASDRMPGGTYLGLCRELITWITMMILAGIVGSAMTGDIGARKIREELDALDVLAVDKFRLLVVPRVMALTFVGLVLPLVTLIITTGATMLAAVPLLHLPLRAQMDDVRLAMNPYDLTSQCLKHVIIGFFLGVVACQQGLAAKGGAEGVGRAVSQTVVISFFGIWLINSLYNMGYETLFPQALGLKG